VDEIEEEEFIRQKYARDDEDPVPWDIEHLAHSPATSTALNYYPLSKFSVFKNIIRTDNHLKFPEFLWVSQNHYDLQWTFNRTLRRLKNVIVVMEYQPSNRSDDPTLRSSILGGLSKALNTMGLAGGQFTEEQENILLRCFSMFDVDDDGKLTPDDIKRVSNFFVDEFVCD
jgi:hypothetical protein